MYAIAILLMCAMAILVGPVLAVEAFQSARPTLGILQIITTLVFVALAIIIIVVHDRRKSFELDICDDDDPKTMTIKNIGGHLFAIAIILVIVIQFCQLGRIV